MIATEEAEDNADLFFLLHAKTATNTRADPDSERTLAGRRYYAALRRHLPHAWSSPADTRLEIADLYRRGSGDGGGGGDGDGYRRPRGDRDRGQEKSQQRPAAAGRGGRSGNGGGRGGGKVRAVVAHTRDGLEAVALSDGRPLGVVRLPAAESGAGVYADLNGDRVVDHVQVLWLIYW